jgi:hypothetical protein
MEIAKINFIKPQKRRENERETIRLGAHHSFVFFLGNERGWSRGKA